MAIVLFEKLPKILFSRGFWRIAPPGRILNETPRPLMLFCMILDLVQYIRQQEVSFKVPPEKQYAKTHAKISFFGSFLNRTLHFKDMLLSVFLIFIPKKIFMVLQYISINYPKIFEMILGFGFFWVGFYLSSGGSDIFCISSTCMGNCT